MNYWHHLVVEILILGDTHFPVVNKKALQKVLRRLEETKFSHIVQVGDLFENHCWSNFAKTSNYTADYEIKLARDMAQDMWFQINKLQKKAKKFQILGNHCARMLKRVQEKLPEGQNLFKSSIMELFKFDKVKTIDDPREELIIGDIAFIHGYKTKLGDHLKFMQQSVVHGHSHRAGIFYLPIKGKSLFEMDVGYLADKSAQELAYTPQKHSNWTVGWGEINNGVPRFIPIGGL